MTPQDLSKYGLEIVKVNKAATGNNPASIRYQLYERGDSGSSAGFRDIGGFDPNQYQGLTMREFNDTWDQGKYGMDWKSDPNYGSLENLQKLGYSGANTSKSNIHVSEIDRIIGEYASRAQNAAYAERIGREIEERNKIAMQNYTPSDPTRAQQIQAQNQAMKGMTNEQLYNQAATLYPDLAKQNPYNNVTPTFQTSSAASQVAASIPNVIPQAQVQGQYLYGADVLDKKANNAAVNSLYNAYFNRDATAAELKNWGVTGGADTTVRSLEDFLKQERVKYGVKGDVGQLGVITKPISINPTKATSDQASGKTNQDVIKAMNENITAAPTGDSFMKGLEVKLAKSETLSKDVTAAMQKSQAERDLELQMLQEKQAYLAELEKTTGQPIPMGFIRGQAAAIERRYQNSLSNQQAKLALLQGDRQQKLDAAKFLYDANRNNLSDTLSFYKETAPQNIGTHIDETTGTMYVVTKNPLTGEVSTINAGNVGAGKKYTSTSIQTDPVTNQMLFIGVKPDGSIETKPLTQGGEKPLSSADRLKYAQDMVANSGYTISMEDALKQIDQAQGSAVTAGTSGNRPDRNNNPLNIKVPSAGLQEAIKRYGDTGLTIDPSPATDGGQFLKFSSPEAGFKAAETLLSMPLYNNLSVDAAMRKWSGGGYGSEVSPSIPRGAMMPSLSQSQKQQLISDMSVREGFTGSVAGGSLGPAQSTTTPTGQTFDQYLQMKQEEAGQSFTPQKVERLRQEFDDAATKATEITTGLRTAASNLIYSLPTEAAKKQLVGEVNKLIAKGDYKGAENKLKTVAISTLKGEEKTEYNVSRAVASGMNTVDKKIQQLKSDGQTAGIYKNAIESAKPYANISKNQKWVELVSAIQGTQAQYRNDLYGASLTDNELEMSNSFFIDPAQDSLSTMLTKSQGLRDLSERVSRRIINQKLGIDDNAEMAGTSRPSLDSFVAGAENTAQSSINPKFIR